MLTVPNMALAVAVVLMLAVVVVVVALCRSAARNTAFDAHAATALALLQPDHPDHPDLPDDDELAAAVDALLADLFPTPHPAPEES